MRFTLLGIYVYLGLENQTSFGLLVKEPTSIIMVILVWDTIVFYVLRRGFLGACLWEWLSIGIWDPKWSVQG